jgi:chemotaxis signal transduction protein
MRTMVRFSMSGIEYCLPVESTRAVRALEGLVPLPAPRQHVAGLLPGDPPLLVLSPFGVGGRRIIVVQADDDVAFGLLVDEVAGLRRIDETSVRTAPRGQERGLVSGTVDMDGELVMVADPTAMGADL